MVKIVQKKGLNDKALSANTYWNTCKLNNAVSEPFNKQGDQGVSVIGIIIQINLFTHKVNLNWACANQLIY